MYSNKLIYTGLLGIGLVFSSMVIRHDVPATAHIALAQKPQFAPSGKVVTNKIMGSCVLIGSRYVLTAAHVLATSDFVEDTVTTPEYTLFTYRPFNIRAVNVEEVKVELEGRRYSVSKIHFHPYAWRDSIAFSKYDMAILELEEAVEELKPALLNTALNELNAKVVAVGYGAYGKADVPSEVIADSIERAGENVIDSVGGYSSNGTPAQLFADMDKPGSPELNETGKAEPQPLEMCLTGGNSGGGLYRKQKGRWELIGIATGMGNDVNKMISQGYYGQMMSWTRVSVFNSWITGVMAADKVLKQ